MASVLQALESPAQNLNQMQDTIEQLKQFRPHCIQTLNLELTTPWIYWMRFATTPGLSLWWN